MLWHLHGLNGKEIVLKYNEAKDEPYELMVWWNTYLGLPYEDEINEDIDPEYLYKNRRIHYQAEIPDDVLFLTCGVIDKMTDWNLNYLVQ